MDLRALVGSQIGDYQLKRVLGRGGMGAVFLGWHLHMQLPFAVKVLRPDLADNHKFLKRFFHEAHQGARLKHENIVTIHNAGLGDIFVAGLPPQMPFLAMEYVEGKNILQVMKKQEQKRLRPAHAVEIVRQALTGMAYAHTEGMIHRDIKPENLLLTPANVVRITDFGLARGDDRPVDPEEAGMIMGTPEYMPLEQWAGSDKVDKRADIYAMGASLYHMLAGTPPFPGRTPLAIMKLVTAGESQAVELVAPDVDPMLSSIVSRMMARDADDRFQTADAALGELERWMQLYEQGTLPGMHTPGSHAAAGFDLEELEGGANQILQDGDVPGLLPAEDEDPLGYQDEESSPGKLSLEFAEDETGMKMKPVSQAAPAASAPARSSVQPSGGRPQSRPQSSGQQAKAGRRGHSQAGRPRASRSPESSPRSSRSPEGRKARPSRPSRPPMTQPHVDDLPEPDDFPPARRGFQLDGQRIVTILLVVGLLVGGLLVLKQFGCNSTGSVPAESR